MNGKIKGDCDECTRHTIYGEKNRKASSERIGAKHNDDRRYHKPYGMNSHCKEQGKDKRMFSDSFEKNQKNTSVAETNAINKTFTSIQMIIVYCGRFDKNDTERHTDYK